MNPDELQLTMYAYVGDDDGAFGPATRSEAGYYNHDEQYATCGVCGRTDDVVGVNIGYCCEPHLRLVCEPCYEEMGDIDGHFETPCLLNWSLIDPPPAEECIAGLRLMLEELTA